MCATAQAREIKCIAETAQICSIAQLVQRSLQDEILICTIAQLRKIQYIAQTAQICAIAQLRNI